MLHHKSPPLRFLLAQMLLAAAVLLVMAWIVHNVAQNLDKIGQGLSFAFLSDRANFSISQSLVAYQSNDSYGRVFFVGLLNTLLVSGLAIVTATVVGVLVGIARLAPNWLMRQWAAVYVETFRNIPLLLQLFFWYFAVLSVLPAPRVSTWKWGCDTSKACLLVLTNRGLDFARPLWTPWTAGCVVAFGVAVVAALGLHFWGRRQQRQTGAQWHTGLWGGLLLLLPIIAWGLGAKASDYSAPILRGFNYAGGVTILPELAALWLALTLYSASYIAEYVRAGVQAVPRGQYEAGQALGLSQGKVMQLVILPQALRVIVPPLTNQFLNIVKNSSLATAIAYPDLVSVFTGTTLNQTGRAIEIITITMAVYLSISLAIALVMNLYHRRQGSLCR